MRCPRFLINVSLVVVVIAPAVFATAFAVGDSASRSIVSAPQITGGEETRRLPAGQPTGSTTLEIAPQPSLPPSAPKIDDLSHQPALRDADDIAAALDRVRPGDTTYITVIRPVIGGGHRTMRVALHIDREIEAPRPN